MNRKIEKEIIRLVDDDEDQRKALRFLLEAAGYEVRDYPSGRDFLVNDEPSVPGCAILDLQMPEMDGLTLLTIMKEREYRLPVVFLSAHGDIPSTVEAMKKGSLKTGRQSETLPAFIRHSSEGQSYAESRHGTGRG